MVSVGEVSELCLYCACTAQQRCLCASQRSHNRSCVEGKVEKRAKGRNEQVDKVLTSGESVEWVDLKTLHLFCRASRVVSGV